MQACSLQSEFVVEVTEEFEREMSAYYYRILRGCPRYGVMGCGRLLGWEVIGG
jgi:hypothetical protein